MAIGRKNWLFAGNDTASVLAKISGTPAEDLVQFLSDIRKAEDDRDQATPS